MERTQDDRQALNNSYQGSIPQSTQKESPSKASFYIQQKQQAFPQQYEQQQQRSNADLSPWVLERMRQR